MCELNFRQHQTWRWSRMAATSLAMALAACSISSNGLGPTTDATAPAGACPAGLTDQASWPARSAATSCSRSCGPDDLGTQTCNQSDRSSCQAKPGCVCLEAPCVTCAICAFPTGLADCYVPTNAENAPSCANHVTTGGSCSPACSRRLCLEADGKSACVCNAEGKYACADWGKSGWL